MITVRYHLGDLAAAVDAAAADLGSTAGHRAALVAGTTRCSRTTRRSAPTAWAGSTRRSESTEVWEDLQAFAAEIAEDCDDVVLMGMGGSSLCSPRC